MSLLSTEPRTEIPDIGQSTGFVRICEIASGGMGRVDLAMKREGAFRRLYAIKRLHRHLCDEADFRAMFLDEARIAGLLRHPAIVSVLDFGTDTEGPFLVMDYIDGVSLGRLLSLTRKRELQIPIQVCVRLMRPVAQGLHAAHELKENNLSLELVHRDLSPQNVLVGFDGSVAITDFGIAKALGKSAKTATGMLKGKMAYMSPEQLKFLEPDRRSDLFAFGVVLYELLSGARLYRNSEGNDGVRRILYEAAPDIGEVRADVPAELAQLLFRLLAKTPENRPDTALEVAEVLESVLMELLASEPAASIAGFVEQIAAEDREGNRIRIERELARVDSELSQEKKVAAVLPEAFPTGRPKKRPLVIAAAALVGGLIIGGVWLNAASHSGASDETTDVTNAPTDGPDPVPPVALAAEPPADPGLPTADPPAADPPEPELEAEAPLSMRTPGSMRGPRTRPREGTTQAAEMVVPTQTMSESSMGGVRTGWDDWE